MTQESGNRRADAIVVGVLTAIAVLVGEHFNNARLIRTIRAEQAHVVTLIQAEQNRQTREKAGEILLRAMKEVRSEISRLQKEGAQPPYQIRTTEVRAALREFRAYANEDAADMNQVSKIREVALLLRYLEDSDVDLQVFMNDDTPFSNAWFRGPTLEGRVFDNGFFLFSDFSGLNCTGISLRSARLFGADFSGSTCRQSGFGGADVTKATFKGADLWRADFSDAVVAGTVFTRADLRCATFRNVEFAVSYADPRHPQSVDFSQARLDGAVFEDCNLKAARGLTQEMIDGASFRGSVTLPNRLMLRTVKPVPGTETGQP